MGTYYHGSSAIFDRFNLDKLGEKNGCKFGVGVYLTESFETAAHYSKPRKGTVDHHYVYTVEVPLKTEDNCLPYYGVPIPSGIIARVEAKMEESLPDLLKGSGRMPDGKGGTKGVSLGKILRKYIAHRLSGVAKEKLVKESQIDKKTTLTGEVKASEFLLSIGVLFIEWPQGSWSKYPNCEKNIAVLDPLKIEIVKIEEVDLDAKAKCVY